MKSLACAIIAIASVVLLSQCKPEESPKVEEKSPSRSSSSGDKKKAGGRADPLEEGAHDKEAWGLAMNRNEAIHALLSRAKPDWLILGPPVTAEESNFTGESQKWKGLDKASFTKSSPETVSEVGGIRIPADLASVQWSSASFDPGHGRILMVPLEMTEPAAMFKIENGEILVGTREEVPSVNYDDKRRWFIQWVTWISDSEIVGVFNEDDFSGHTTARAGIYLYEVDSRELRRVDLPYAFVSGNDPGIEIVSVSPESLVIRTTDGEKVVSLKR